MPEITVGLADPRKAASGGTTGFWQMEKSGNSGAICPQNGKICYTGMVPFPLWITAVGTAVFT